MPHNLGNKKHVQGSSDLQGTEKRQATSLMLSVFKRNNRQKELQAGTFMPASENGKR